jgi:cytochrome c553
MRLFLAAVLWICVAGMAQADPDVAAGKARAAAKCDNCHGGGADADGDPLAGMPADKIIKAMNEYRAKTRKNAGMRKRAAEVSEQDIENIAAYYAQQPKKAK